MWSVCSIRVQHSSGLTLFLMCVRGNDNPQPVSAVKNPAIGKCVPKGINNDSLLVEEIKGFAFVTGQLLQGAAPLLDGRLNLRGGCVVLDIHRGLRRRLLGRRARRAEQTAETGGVRAGKWGGKRRKHTHQRIEGVDTSSSSSGRGRVPHVRVKRYRSHTPTRHASFHAGSRYQTLLRIFSFATQERIGPSPKQQSARAAVLPECWSTGLILSTD